MANFKKTVWASQIRKTTEDYILTHTLAEVREFIKAHGVIEEDEGEYSLFIPWGEHKIVKGKTYDMQGTEFRYDEFVITEDGRVFLAVSLMENIEVIDDTKTLYQTDNFELVECECIGIHDTHIKKLEVVSHGLAKKHVVKIQLEAKGCPKLDGVPRRYRYSGANVVHGTRHKKDTIEETREYIGVLAEAVVFIYNTIDVICSW